MTDGCTWAFVLAVIANASAYMALISSLYWQHKRNEQLLERLTGIQAQRKERKASGRVVTPYIEDNSKEE